jgi:DNA-binding IclR family transcriptional regulator
MRTMTRTSLRPSSRHPGAGAQTVDRACDLLRELGRRGASGARLIDLTEASGLSRPTVHRILRSLLAAEFVRQDARTRRYNVGGALYALGLAAPSPLDRLADIRPILDGFATRTGDTAYLVLRQGDEMLCLARVEGATPIRTYVIEVGALRPIGAMLAGITLLAALDDDEVSAVLARTAAARARFPNATDDYVRGQIASIRREGYGLSEGRLIPGATGLSAPVPTRDGRPYLAVSFSAISTRVPRSRVKPLAADLLATCARIAEVMGGGRRGPV